MVSKIYMNKPSLEYMQELLVSSGIHLETPKIEKLWAYHKLLRQNNPILNLTRIHNFENMVRKHYIDCLFVTKILHQKNIILPRSLLDIGSGPGFPGIPLALENPDHFFYLAEARKARANFLLEVVEKLALKNVEVYSHSISLEHCPMTESVITRALEAMSSTLQRLERGLSQTGLVLFMKGPSCHEEIEAVKKEALPYEILLDYHYTLPRSKDKRRLVIWQKSYASVQIQNNYPNLKEPHRQLIQSCSNPHFKLIHHLKYSRYVKKYQQTLVCGKKICGEFLRERPELCQKWIYPEKSDAIPNNLEWPILIFSRDLFSKLDFMGTGPPLILASCPTLFTWDKTHDLHSISTTNTHGKPKLPITLFLPFANPENLGAALRSCAAFPPAHIVLLKEACHPYHPKAIRTAAGYSFGLKLAEGPTLNELIQIFRNKKQKLFALDPKAQETIETVQWQPPISLIVGHEGQGLAGHTDVHRLKIITDTTVESLNANVAVGITLYALSQKGF